MREMCCHSQVRATLFFSTLSACLWARKLYAQQTALKYSPVPVLPRVTNHYIRPDHDMVIDFQINTWCAWTRITVVLRLTQGNRYSMVTLGSQPTTYSPTHKHFSYNQWHPIAFNDSVCYNSGTISYRGASLLNSHNLPGLWLFLIYTDKSLGMPFSHIRIYLKCCPHRKSWHLAQSF